MNDNPFKDALDHLFKNTVTIEPRELFPFKAGDGILQKCIERYIQSKINQHRNIDEKEILNVNCSHIAVKEERLFNDLLFNLFFNSEYVNGTEFFIIIEEFSMLVDMTNEEIRSILNGLTMINIEIRDEDGSFLSISSIFPGYETGNYDSEDHYYALNINTDFLKTCSEIKAEMD